MHLTGNDKEEEINKIVQEKINEMINDLSILKACVLIACKVTENQRRTRDVINCFQFCKIKDDDAAEDFNLMMDSEVSLSLTHTHTHTLYLYLYLVFTLLLFFHRYFFFYLRNFGN